MEKYNIYSFVGLPASGKGTQAEILAKKLDVEKIVGIGDLARKIIAKDSKDPFDIEIKKTYEKGAPLSDEIAIDLIRRYLDEAGGNVILDNFPFTEKQADFLNDYIAHSDKWDKLYPIFINIQPETSVKRITTRKVCSDCGAIYGSDFNEMICEKCGGSLSTRVDDNPETVRNRIGFYAPQIAKLKNYLKYKIEINGEQPIKDVASELANSLWKTN